MEWKRPFGRMPWPSRAARAAGIRRADFERFLEVNHPGAGAERRRLRLLITFVLLLYGDRDAVLRRAPDWGLKPTKAEEFVRGDVEFGFRWYSIEGMLTDCGAEPALVELARELFYEFGRGEAPRTSPVAAATPVQAASAAPAPAFAAEPGASGAEEGESGERCEGAGTAGSRPAEREGQTARKPDPGTVTTTAELIQRMQAYRFWKGRPSFRSMAAGTRYAHTTFSGLARRTRLPSLELVLAYIRACGADEAELAAWQEAWQRLSITESGTPEG
ncbi:hypothetical protein [Spirillospora sp. NPDC029432]|uniref:hypothetical protein n=1 Tax=Spirillospora sp. NPDC029432 TaxID=3154599 RepID=UPI00345320FB